MIQVIARDPQVFSLFSRSNFSIIERQDNYSIVKLNYNGNDFKLKIVIETDEPNFKGSGDNKGASVDFFEDNKKSIYINPPNDSIFIMDRWVFVSVWVELFKTYGVGFVKKLEKIYKERNCKVVFALSYFEPLDYEDRHYSACNYEYDFDFIRFSDYPLFEGLKNTKTDTFFNFWNYIYDILAYEVSPNNGDKIRNGIEVYEDWLKNVVVPKDDRPKVYGMLGGKPRYHRMYFINKIIENGLIERGYVTMNRFFLDEYKLFIKDKNYSTDPTNLYKKDIEKYWNYDFYKNDSYYKDIIDPLGLEKRFEYTTENIINQEYNESYIEIVAETHILFNKLYDFWSEKTYHGIFFEKLFISVGANKFYREFEKLGGHTFIKEIGINPEFLNEEDPIIQMNYVIEALEKITLEDAKQIYLSNKNKIKENKQILLDWIYNNTEFIRDYILNDLTLT